MSPVSKQSSSSNLPLAEEESQPLSKVGDPRSHSEPGTGLDAQARLFPVKCETSQTGLEQDERQVHGSEL